MGDKPAPVPVAGYPSRVRTGTLTAMTWKQRAAIPLCLIVAFFFMAPLVASVVEDTELGARPGMFLIGCSALLGVATVFVDPEGKKPYLDRIRNVLLIVGVGLFVAWPLLWP
jgi:H+/gluconate symporter-like permease